MIRESPDEHLNANRFFALTLDLLCVAGFDGYFKQLNPTWEKVLGWTQAELRARPYLDFVHPDDRAATVAEAQKLVAGAPVVTFENRYRCKDGSYKWLLWNAMPVAEEEVIYAAARDIGDRKQTEAELHEIMTRYRSLFAGVPVGIYRSTPAGAILDANPALIEMLGYPDRESLSATGASALYVNLADRHRWQNALEREGVVRGFEVQLRKRDGTLIWVRDSARALRDGDGQVLHYEGIWEDVTQHRQAMEELSKLSSAVERTPDPVIITNADGKIEYVNRAFKKVSGFTDQDVVGKTPRILKSGTHPPEFYRRLWDTLLAGKPWRGTFVNRRKDGQLYFAEASIAPVFSLQGRITHFVSVERDITERKQAEKALQEHAAEISDLYNNAPCGYHSLDADGVFIRINDTELRWLGYTRDEIIGKKKFAEVLTNESARLFLNNFSLLKEQGSCREVELQMVRKDGTILPVLASATALKDNVGNLRMTRTTVFDITERQALQRLKEQEWRAAQEREIAMQVQARLFPQTAPVLETLECAGTCAQASVVGGDYFDFLNLGSGQVGLVVADVSGKGLPGALLMASLQAVLRAERDDLALDDLPRMLRRVNKLLYESTDANVFASLFLGVYEESDRCLRYANCGHNPPLLLRTSGTVEELTEACPVLGVLQDWECATAEVKLAPGDILVAYTDGVVEAGIDAGEEFGVARLVETVQANRHLSVSSLLTLIGTAVREFSAGRQIDDQTLVVARAR